MKLLRVLRALSLLILLLSASMLLPACVALYYGDGDAFALFLSALLSAGVGGLLRYLSRRQPSGDMNIKEAFAVVGLGWTVMAILGALPFLISQTIPLPQDALFESMSGFTTTGASILRSPQDLPHGIAFWRCFIQWIGGLGIVLFVLALLPNAGGGGKYLFRAETPGPSSEKITPRLRDTAKMLWLIYFTLTAGEALLLWAGGMSFFDSWAHSFTTMATGGFSTRNASLGYWQSPFIQGTVTLFMFLAGTNFALYFRVVRERSLLPMFRDNEWRSYAGIAGVSALLIFVLLWAGGYHGAGRSLLHSLFQTASIMTTTGFATDDFNLWPEASRILLLLLMLIGGMAGSTGGGMKVVRVKVLLAHAHQCLRKMIHPRLVTVVRVGPRAVAPELVSNITGFAVLYLTLLIGGSLLLALFAHSFEVSLTATLACLSNIGPGLGAVGPSGHYADIHVVGKVMLTGLMLLGRLEVYTVLVLLSRNFWRK